MAEEPANSQGDFLNSTALWTIVSIVASIIIGLLFFILSQQNKSISYDYSITNAFESPDNSLRIYYKGKPVENIIVLNLTIKNTGKKSIKKDDVLSGMDFALPSSCEILTYNIVSSNPHDAEGQFKSDAKFTGNIFTFKPILINKGEFAKFSIIASNCSVKSLAVSARIDESVLSRDKNLDSKEIYMPLPFVGGILLLMLGLVSFNNLEPEMSNLKMKIYNLDERLRRISKFAYAGNDFEKERDNIISWKKKYESDIRGMIATRPKVISQKIAAKYALISAGIVICFFSLLI